MNIFLLGKHSNRTPLSYAVYRPIAESFGLNYVDDIYSADCVIFGFSIDIPLHVLELSKALSRNPGLKVVVLSEEPLWDTVWSSNFDVKRSYVSVGGDVIQYININHFTSDVYDFVDLPYFVTTDDRYVIRYSNMLSRNVRYSRSKIIENLSNREFVFSSIAEKRTEAQFHRALGGRLVGLSRLRTQVADCFRLKKRCVGKGWSDNTPRQKEIDWHLAKLAEFDGASVMMSAIENTAHNNYITEKIFDAYSMLSFPVYQASEQHRVRGLVKNDSALFFESEDVDFIVGSIEEFYYDWRRRVDALYEDMVHLNLLVSAFDRLHSERVCLIRRLTRALAEVISGEG